MKTKYCSSCEREHPITEFSKKGLGHQSTCREARGKDRRAHHADFKNSLRSLRLQKQMSMARGSE